MSESEYPTAKEASDDELASLLARRTTRGRAKSTTVMIAILLVLLGVLIGVP